MLSKLISRSETDKIKKHVIIDVSVVVPVFNEQENLPEFVSRIAAVMGGLPRSYEVVFVDDGSTDQSFQILKKSAEQNPHLKIVRLSRNFGQHAAVFAGLEKSRGEIVVTLDADLQNPPEEIPKLLQKMDEGYEVVGGYRENRQDSIFRKIPTYLVARIASRLVKTPLKDYGCMLSAYRRELVEAMLESGEVSTYIPALANSLSGSVTEIPVAHNARTRGESKYSLLRLLHLNDLMTSFSLLPISPRILGVAVAFGFSFSFC